MRREDLSALWGNPLLRQGNSPSTLGKQAVPSGVMLRVSQAIGTGLFMMKRVANALLYTQPLPFRRHDLGLDVRIAWAGWHWVCRARHSPQYTRDQARKTFPHQAMIFGWITREQTWNTTIPHVAHQQTSLRGGPIKSKSVPA